MLSIIVPAYNEEKQIGRCLDALLVSSADLPVEIIVVCNGCRDNTFAIASSYSDIQVLNTELGNKPNAFNLGESIARYPARLYVDGDLIVSSNLVATVLHELFEAETELVAPPMRLNEGGVSWVVRAHNKIWTQSPYYQRRVGGVIGLSATARARFGLFPDVIADDAFLESQVDPALISVPPEIYFIAESPSTMKALVATKTRSRVGYLSNQHRPAVAVTANSNSRLLKRFALQPSCWVALVAYTAIKLIVRFKAAQRIKQGQVAVWDRDETAR